jgi:hypothetical protein
MHPFLRNQDCRHNDKCSPGLRAEVTEYAENAKSSEKKHGSMTREEQRLRNDTEIEYIRIKARVLVLP